MKCVLQRMVRERIRGTPPDAGIAILCLEEPLWRGPSVENPTDKDGLLLKHQIKSTVLGYWACNLNAIACRRRSLVTNLVGVARHYFPSIYFLAQSLSNNNRQRSVSNFASCSLPSDSAGHYEPHSLQPTKAC